jgi:Pre-mRNA-splicing factor of RES complex
LTVARHADDEEMNEGLKGVIRWDDPIAAYMMKKQEEEGGGGGGRATGRSVTEGNGGGREARGEKCTKERHRQIDMGLSLGGDGMAWIGAMDLRKSGSRREAGRLGMRTWTTSGRWTNESRCRCSLQFQL